MKSLNPLTTPQLQLILEDLEAARQRIAEPEEFKKELSEAWLANFAKAEPGDPWLLGFRIFRNGHTDNSVGQCGFKGPPNDEGDVEIAYAIDPEWQGNGFATEAARALTEFALQQPGVQRVLAHTLPETNASVSVLARCGFNKVGEVIDPDDGPVWRFEKT